MNVASKDGAGPGPGLGTRLREVRRRRMLSVRELARRVGCSASLVSQIERGASAPSATMVYLLATELQTSLDYLFGVDPAHSMNGGAAAGAPNVAPRVATTAGGVVVAHGGEDAVSARQAATFGRRREDIVQPVGSRACIELASGVRWERLTPSSEPYVDFLEVVYQPQAHSDGSRRALRHDGREYGLVLNGQLHVDVGFETYQLGQGDSIAFDSSTPHAYWNPTDELVHAISLIVHREPWRA